mmetsp:Transcript_103301/g.316140  ORF Transcript_103301/g.316140 Transcript_103301/m.316140 type:complete len:222 (+) Transcript_103301:265-930(+)
MLHREQGLTRGSRAAVGPVSLTNDTARISSSSHAPQPLMWMLGRKCSQRRGAQPLSRLFKSSKEACVVTRTGKPSANAVSPTPYFGSVARRACLATRTSRTPSFPRKAWNQFAAASPWSTPSTVSSQTVTCLGAALASSTLGTHNGAGSLPDGDAPSGRTALSMMPSGFGKSGCTNDMRGKVRWLMKLPFALTSMYSRSSRRPQAVSSALGTAWPRQPLMG